jgi:hypothetical protein
MIFSRNGFEQRLVVHREQNIRPGGTLFCIRGSGGIRSQVAPFSRARDPASLVRRKLLTSLRLSNSYVTCRRARYSASAQENIRLTAVFSTGGSGGIRTLDAGYRIHDFESCAFNQLSHASIFEYFSMSVAKSR